MIELPVKALTWLFKKNLQPLATTPVQDSAPDEAGSRESQPLADHAVLSVAEG